MAVRQLGYIRQNPSDGISRQKVADTELRYVTTDEFMALFKASLRWWKVLLSLCYTGGLRLNEAINLPRSDVDFERDEIRVIAKREADDLHRWQPKDVDSRTVPLPPSTIALLTRLYAETDESPYVLISRKRLETIKAAKAAGVWVENSQTVNNLRRDWLAIVKAAKITHATLHDLRRSAITNWARCLPAHVVQQLAGHASYETTRRYYTAVTAGDMAEARRAIERAVLGTKKGTTDPEVTPMGDFVPDSGR